MKKLKYTLIALLVLCMTGCNESSFLEEDRVLHSTLKIC